MTLIIHQVILIQRSYHQTRKAAVQGLTLRNSWNLGVFLLEEMQISESFWRLGFSIDGSKV